jgi:2-keto-4-pentenoate hydratase/2-oxohepta-3-ene-1,7-dioic acid hydratase in catechol pathway
LKIVRFAADSQPPCYGVLESNFTIKLIEGDIFGRWKQTTREIDFKAVELLAPVEPPNILAIGRNYRGHVAEAGEATPKAPILFIKANTALAGPNQPILLPRIASNEVDYEAELVVVLGRRAHNVSESEALDYVLGYTCGNDVSARDCQHRIDKQWARGKSFDTFAPLGPWIETDLNSDSLAIRCRLNGETMQSSSTRDLIFNTRHLISYLSECMTLKPGTVIMTGTPAGVGFTRRPPVFLKAGDVVEVEIEGIGTLRNPVAREQ